MSSAEPHSSPPAKVDPKADPVLRNALRYTISPKEYETLHQYLIKRSPPSVRKRVPQPRRYNAIVKSKNDYNAAAVRASLRVFVGTATGLKVWDLIVTHILARGRPQKYDGSFLSLSRPSDSLLQTKILDFYTSIPQLPPFSLPLPYPLPPPNPPSFLHPPSSQSPQ